MTRSTLSLLIVLALGTMLAFAQAPATETDLAKGMRQVDEGDLDGAVVTLDGVVRTLLGRPGRERELARAHLYLGIAYLGLEQRERARSAMREACAKDGELRLETGDFPPRVVQMFEESRREALAARPPSAAPPPPAPVATPAMAAASPVPPRKGKPILPILLGVGAAGGVAAALGGGGGSSGSPGTVPTPPPGTVSPGTVTFLSSDPAPGSTVTLTNNAFPLRVTVSVTASQDAPDAAVGGALVTAGTWECSAAVVGTRVALVRSRATTVTVGAFNYSPDGLNCFRGGVQRLEIERVRIFALGAGNAAVAEGTFPARYTLVVP